MVKLQKIQKSFGRVLANKGHQVRGNSNQRGYTYAWQQARAAWLAEQPICARCGVLGSVLDHIAPHRGDQRLFWDRSNWQTLCKPCHDGDKQREETRNRYA